MNHRITVAALVGAAVLGCVGGHALSVRQDLTPERATVAYVAEPDVPTIEPDLDAWLDVHFPASPAWLAADSLEQEVVSQTYFGEIGYGGCRRDLEFSYLGTGTDENAAYSALDVPGQPGTYFLLAEYVDGVCGE